MQRPLKICGLGRYLPRRLVHNHELGPACGLTSDEVFQRTGVRTRHRAEPGLETAAIMGAHAAEEALADARFDRRDVDLLINASATPEQALPDTGPFIQRALGLGESGIPCLGVNSACLSFMAALDVAASLLHTERYRRILIVSSEISAVGLDAQDPETAPLFGDAAAAVVVTRPEPGESSCLHHVCFETFGEGASLTEIPGCGTKHPPSAPETRVAHSLFRMQGTALLKLAAKRGRPFLQRFSREIGDAAMDDGLVIAHQPSRAGLRMLALLGIAEARMVITLPELGNCVAASIPLGLYAAVRDGRLQRGQRAILLGTGAGVTFGAALLTY
jgi:3-oxoacyl-[acyl-carrier-protein] synthase-3